MPGSDFEGTWNSLASIGMGSSAPMAPRVAVPASQVKPEFRSFTPGFVMLGESPNARLCLEIISNNVEGVLVALKAGANPCYANGFNDEVILFLLKLIEDGEQSGVDMVKLMLNYGNRRDNVMLMQRLLGFDADPVRSGRPQSGSICKILLMHLVDSGKIEAVKFLLNYDKAADDYFEVSSTELYIVTFLNSVDGRHCRALGDAGYCRGLLKSDRLNKLYSWFEKYGLFASLEPILQGDYGALTGLVEFFSFLVEGGDELKVLMAHELLKLMVFESEDFLLEQCLRCVTGGAFRQLFFYVLGGVSSSNIDLNAVNENGDTLLLLALRSADFDLIKVLFGSGYAWNQGVLDRFIEAAKAAGHDDIVNYYYSIEPWRMRFLRYLSPLLADSGTDDAYGVVPAVVSDDEEEERASDSNTGEQEEEDDGFHRARKPLPKKRR